MHYLITGGAGFIGSHLSDKLVGEGHKVTVLDNLSTGKIDNIEHLEGNPDFHLVVGTILNEFLVDKLAERSPLHRIGDDEDLKGVAALFASDASKHITGQILAVDGGVSVV